MGGDEEGVGQELRLLYLDSLSSFLDSRHRGPQNQNQNLDILQVLGQSDRKSFPWKLDQNLKNCKKKKQKTKKHTQTKPLFSLFYYFFYVSWMEILSIFQTR